jgi:flagellar assembly protein FliH
MTLSPITLESFELTEPQTAPESPDFRRGFEAGLAAANETQQAATATAIQELSSTINDMNFGFEEARVHLLSKLRPLLSQLSEAALPEILHQSFGAHLNETIETQFNHLADETLSIAVTPEVASHLEANLQEKNPRFVFAADPDLDAGQAVIKGGNSQVMLDLQSLLHTLQTALSGLEAIQGMENHG